MSVLAKGLGLLTAVTCLVWIAVLSHWRHASR